MAEEVRIDFKSTADTSGADRMGAAVKGIAGDSGKAAAGVGAVSKESQALAGALGKNVEVGGQAVSMMSQLEGASKGGAMGLASAARAGLAFGQMVKGVLAGAGPIGIAVTAITLLGAAAFGLVKAFAAPKESIEDFKARIANLDKANLQALDATIAALSDRLKAAKADADAVRQSLDMIDDAEMGAKLAANKVSGLGTKEQATQELLIRDEFKQRRQARQQEAAEQVRDQAKEQRDALAPQFEASREDYIQKLNTLNENKALAKETKAAWDEVVRLQDSVQGSGDRKGWAAVRAQTAKAKELQSRLPSTEEAAKMDAELASSRDAFQGKDGIAGKYQPAAQAAIAAEKSLARLLDTRKKVGDWEKAQVRLENGGVDPRDTEAAARKSPGRARMIGPDGAVREYDVAAPQTTNQGIAKIASAARDGIAPPTTGRGAYREDALKPAADKVGDAAASNDKAGADAAAQLTIIATGSEKIATNTAQLTTGITEAATGLGSANDNLAQAISTATANLGTTFSQAVALGQANVEAYSYLSAEVRVLSQQVRTAMAQLAAARSKKS